MTDQPETFGLGAFQPIPDDRDEPIAVLYAAAGIDPSAALPASYAAPTMPPVTNQGNTPMCVAFSSAAMKSWQDRADGRVSIWFDFDESRFFRWIGGTANGAWVRDAMKVMLGRGYPVTGKADYSAADHRIRGYYAIARRRSDLQAAILALGPVVIATPWYQSWFRPDARGVLPNPSYAVGGHAIVAYGWDSRGLRCRNSWGAAWGVGGDFWMPWQHVAGLWEAWKASDIPAPVYFSFGGRALANPRTFVVTSRYAAVRPRPSTSATKVDTLRRGEQWTPRQVTGSGKGRWLGNRRGDKWVRITDVRTAASAAVADEEEE
jgi:hypothetical protein